MPSLYGINLYYTFIYQGRDAYPPSELSFIYEDYGCGKKFTSDTSKLINLPVKEYRWVVVVKEVPITYGPNDKVFIYAWPYPEEFEIIHEVVDSKDNVITTAQAFDVDGCPKGGGGGIDIRWRDKIPPKIIIKDLNEQNINRIPIIKIESEKINEKI